MEILLALLVIALPLGLAWWLVGRKGMRRNTVDDNAQRPPPPHRGTP